MKHIKANNPSIRLSRAVQRTVMAMACVASMHVCATDAQPADGYLGRLLFSDDGEAKTGIKLGGWTQIGAVLKETKGQQGGLGNSPIVLARDNGIQLNQIYVYLSKDIRSNIIPRVTPSPAPVFDDYSFGFQVDILYGRDGQPLQTFGWDDKWGVNAPGNHDPARAGRDRQDFLVNPQAYIQGYVPWGLGATFMLGNFMSPLGNEIGFHFQPGPNIFYSHTYAFAAAPIKHTGLLVDVNILKDDAYGLLAGEFGIVNGWSNFQDNNKKPAYLGGLRYRTPDMATWVDYEFMTGAAQSSMSRLLVDSRNANVPLTRVMSPRPQNKTQHFLIIAHDWNKKWRGQAAYNYGKQKGDGGSDTIDILSGAGFKGATWQGLEARLLYAINEQLSVAARIEKFQDRDGFALFPGTAGIRSDFNAVTIGTQWWANKHTLFRPEIRHDWQSSNNGAKAFNNGLSDRQTSLNADLLVYF